MSSMHVGAYVCIGDSLFNLLQDLVPRLRREWTNLLTETAFDSFW